MGSPQQPLQPAASSGIQKQDSAYERGHVRGRVMVYQDAKAAIGDMNRRARKDRHDVAIFSERNLARLRREVFVVMNRRRGRLSRALKALTAAEAALAAVTH